MRQWHTIALLLATLPVSVLSFDISFSYSADPNARPAFKEYPRYECNRVPVGNDARQDVLQQISIRQYSKNPQAIAYYYSPDVNRGKCELSDAKLIAYYHEAPGSMQSFTPLYAHLTHFKELTADSPEWNHVTISEDQELRAGDVIDKVGLDFEIDQQEISIIHNVVEVEGEDPIDLSIPADTEPRAMQMAPTGTGVDHRATANMVPGRPQGRPVRRGRRQRASAPDRSTALQGIDLRVEEALDRIENIRGIRGTIASRGGYMPVPDTILNEYGNRPDIMSAFETSEVEEALARDFRASDPVAYSMRLAGMRPEALMGYRVPTLDRYDELGGVVMLNRNALSPIRRRPPSPDDLRSLSFNSWMQFLPPS